MIYQVFKGFSNAVHVGRHVPGAYEHSEDVGRCMGGAAAVQLHPRHVRGHVHMQVAQREHLATAQERYQAIELDELHQRSHLYGSFKRHQSLLLNIQRREHVVWS